MKDEWMNEWMNIFLRSVSCCGVGGSPSFPGIFVFLYNVYTSCSTTQPCTLIVKQPDLK